MKNNIALIGLGYWGNNILRSLYELEYLHTACDSNRTLVDKKRAQYPKTNYLTSPDNIAGNAAIRAVVIATPANTHYELAKKFLLANKDVLVEKPLSLHASQAKELIKIAQENKRILMVGHILQYHPAVIKLKKMILNGDLGKIQYIYSNRLNIGKLRTTENILWSFAPHDISTILMLLDEEPVSVSCFGEAYLNKGIYDTTITTMRFTNSTCAHIHVSWLHPFKEQKLVVIGSYGMAVFDDTSEFNLKYYPHSIMWENGKTPIAEKAKPEVIEIGKEEPLKQELIHFAECVERRITPKTDGEEGLRVLKVLEMAEDALRESIGNDS